MIFSVILHTNITVHSVNEVLQNTNKQHNLLLTSCLKQIGEDIIHATMHMQVMVYHELEVSCIYNVT